MNLVRNAWTLLLVGLLALGCGSEGGRIEGSGVGAGSGVEARDTTRLRNQVQSLMGEKEEYATELERTLQRLGELEQAHESLVAAGEVSDTQIKTLKAALEEQGGAIAGVQSAHAALEGRYATLQDTLREKGDALGVLTVKLKSLEKKVTLASQRGVAFEALIERLKKQVASAKDEIAHVQDERAALKTKLKEAVAEKLKHQGDSWRLEMEVGAARHEVAVLTSENDQLEAKVKALADKSASTVSRDTEAEVGERESGNEVDETGGLETASGTLPPVKPDSVSDTAGGAAPPLSAANDAAEATSGTGEGVVQENVGNETGRPSLEERRAARDARRAARDARRAEQLALLARVAEGDLDVIEALQKAGNGVEARDADGLPALLVAARNGHASMIEALLIAGAKLYSTDNAGNTALHHAAAAHQIYEIKMLHAKGADIEAQNRNHFTPLHVAIEVGDVEAVRTLAELGANSSFSYYDGGTVDPMLVAYAGEHLEVAALLRELSADHGILFFAQHGDIAGIKYCLAKNPIAIKTTRLLSMETALLVAIRMQQYDAASFLMENGGSIFDTDLSHNTALSIAVHNDSKEGVLFAMRNGYPISRTLGSKLSSYAQIHTSVKLDSIDMVKFLLRSGAEVNQLDGRGNTPLHRTVAANRLPMAALLIEKGAYVNTRNRNGETPLHLAAHNGRIKLVRLLLASGAEMNIANRQHDHPFHLAAYGGHLDVVKVMLEGGYDFKSLGRDRSTPFFLAALAGRRDVVPYLHKAGADINVQNEHGLTPLHASLQQSSVRVPKYLLEQGADVNLRDDNGQTPLLAAASAGRLEMVRAILKRGAALESEDKRGRTPLFYGLDDDNGALTEFFLGMDANVNHKAKDGWTPLHASAETGSVASMKLLLASGSAVDAVDAQGRTPLHIAAIRGSQDHARMLVANNADRTATDLRGQGILHLLNEKNRRSIIIYFLRIGANLHLRDKDGNTPLLIAASRPNPKMIEIFGVTVSALAVMNDAGKNALKLVTEQFEERKDGTKWLPAKVKRQELLLEVHLLLLKQIGTAIHRATQTGNIQLLKSFLDAYPDRLHTKQKRLPPVLWTAINSGQLEAVKFLVSLGAHAPYTNRFGQQINDVEMFFMLHEAAAGGHLEILRYFIEDLGFAGNKPNRDGKTPLELAKRSRRATVVEYLAGLEAAQSAGDRVATSESL